MSQPSATLNREILRLALPALGALAAEPVFLLADTAMVGHLGEVALGGLAVASTVLQTVLGLMIFLAYATTPRVARRLGRGDTRGAVSAGFDGMWLALVTSVILLAVGLPFLETIVVAFGLPPVAVPGAVSYLTISWWGLPCMLVVIAATGLLRGLQDTRTPLIVAACGFGINIALNALFIYGLGMGIEGSALGTVTAHGLMCIVYVIIAVRAAVRYKASLKPDWVGVLLAARTSGWLLLRNAALRLALITLVSLAAYGGTAELAALQITLTLFTCLALVLDSLAIAGQALVGLQIGRGDRAMVRAVNRRLAMWGVGFGCIVGLLLAAMSPWIGRFFTSDPEVIGITLKLVLVLAVSLPLAGYVFTIDGILMGAEDARYLALAQVGACYGFAILTAAVESVWPSIVALWACFAIGFMALRAIGLGARMGSDKWIIRAEKLQ